MTLSPAERIASFGTDEEAPTRRILRAGALSAELESGNIRYVRWGGKEVLRGIAFLVRDTGWGTYAPELSDLTVEESGREFRVSYRARCSGPEGTFGYDARIWGSAEGTLEFTGTGTPESDFPANRIGFVVLHPLDGVAGAEVRLEHTDGKEETIRLPELVSPDQPAFDLRAVTHSPAAGVTAKVLMEGDAFEMEDHRNWTDASFKTYVRPLAKPRPFTTHGGETISQSVRLTVAGPAEGLGGGSAGDSSAVEISDVVGRMPRIALAVDGSEVREAIAALPLLRETGIRHLAARFDSGRGHGREAMEGFAALASGTGARLTLECVIDGVDPERELGGVAQMAAAAGLRVDAVLPLPRRDMKTRPSNTLPSGEASSEEIHRAARSSFPGAEIGVGVATNFTELNRNRPPPGLGDFVSHSTSAVVHAADDRSVMETLQALPFVFRSTRSFVGPTLPYRVGLAAIGADTNPYGASVADNPQDRRITMARSDPRQRGEFAAAFAVGYLAAAVAGRIAEVVIGHVAGPLGVIGTPDREFPGGRPRPVYRVVAELARAEGAPCRTVAASNRGLAGLAWEDGPAGALFLANLTDGPISPILPAPYRSERTPAGGAALPPFLATLIRTA